MGGNQGKHRDGRLRLIRDLDASLDCIPLNLANIGVIGCDNEDPMCTKRWVGVDDDFEGCVAGASVIEGRWGDRGMMEHSVGGQLSYRPVLVVSW
jgi:hypothetical protein